VKTPTAAKGFAVGENTNSGEKCIIVSTIIYCLKHSYSLNGFLSPFRVGV
jgi:hypothetical protein